MPDREKVIKGLECCRECTKDDLSHSDEPCEECPYLVNGNACSPWELFDDALALLKEQEAMKVRYTAMGGLRYGACPKCDSRIDNLVNPKACGFCGQELKWE